jgi:hypothetical protein
MNFNSTEVNLDEDEVFNKRVEGFKKELEYKQNEILKRTNEINELMSLKKQLNNLKEELEIATIKSKKDNEKMAQLESCLKREQSKNESYEIKINELEEKVSQFCKNSEFQKQANLKKIKHVETQLQQEKENTLKISKILEDEQSEVVLLKAEIDRLKTNNTGHERKYNILVNDFEKLKEDHHFLKKNLEEKAAHFEKELITKENDLKAIQKDLEISHSKCQAKILECDANLTALTGDNEIKLRDVQSKYEKMIKQLKEENLKEINELGGRLEIENANRLKKVNDEKHSLEIAFEKLKKEHEVFLSDFEANKNEAEASIYHFKNENSLLKYKLSIFTNFASESAISFKRNFDEMKNEINSFSLEQFQNFKKLKEETETMKSETDQLNFHLQRPKSSDALT